MISNDFVNLRKLYDLRSTLNSVEEINIIDSLICKRNMSLDYTFDELDSYSKKDISKMSIQINNIYKKAQEYCFEVYGVVLNSYSECFEEDIDKIYDEFAMIKLKIHKSKDSPIKNAAKDNLKIIIEDRIIKTILKHFKK